MATAKAKKVAITYSDITLKLSPREAETLYVVTQYIGGGFESRRADMDSIRDALRDAVPVLIAPIDYPVYKKFIGGKGHVFFKDDKEVK